MSPSKKELEKTTNVILKLQRLAEDLRLLNKTLNSYTVTPKTAEHFQQAEELKNGIHDMLQHNNSIINELKNTNHLKDNSAITQHQLHAKSLREKVIIYLTACQ